MALIILVLMVYKLFQQLLKRQKKRQKKKKRVNYDYNLTIIKKKDEMIKLVKYVD